MPRAAVHVALFALICPLAAWLVSFAALAGFITFFDPKPRPNVPATIVVFSGSQLEDGRLGLSTRQRMAAAIALYRPGDVMLVTGRSRLDPPNTTADRMAAHARTKGIPVITEPLARTTEGNARLSAEILSSRPDRPIILVTNRFHLPRSWLYLWNAGGDQITLAPADTAREHWHHWGIRRLPRELQLIWGAARHVATDGPRPTLHPDAH